MDTFVKEINNSFFHKINCWFSIFILGYYLCTNDNKLKIKFYWNKKIPKLFRTNINFYVPISKILYYEYYVIAKCPFIFPGQF